jgi:hypothetical protein
MGWNPSHKMWKEGGMQNPEPSVPTLQDSMSLEAHMSLNIIKVTLLRVIYIVWNDPGKWCFL